MRTFFKALVSKNTTTWRFAPNLWVTINSHKKLCLPVITWNKKHSSQQVASMIDTLGKDFFPTATFKGL